MTTVMTVGHSTLEAAEFTEVLQRHEISCVADVRRHPGSRRMPRWNADALDELLAAHGIGYVHLPELGGRRKPVPDSPNGGWRKDGFRAYADHMATAEFTAGADELMALAGRRCTAVMCAEALWWRCHRRLVADALVVREFEVRHIRAGAEAEPHELTPFAVVDGERITYPPVQAQLEH